MKYGVYRNPLWQSMQHLVNHGTYHRGQVTTMLRQLGAQPILTDLMHFYREHAAAARRDLDARNGERIRTIAWMKEKAREARLEQRVIGFVPTMGALHAGHTGTGGTGGEECSPCVSRRFF